MDFPDFNNPTVRRGGHLIELFRQRNTATAQKLTVVFFSPCGLFLGPSQPVGLSAIGKEFVNQQEPSAILKAQADTQGLNLRSTY